MKHPDAGWFSLTGERGSETEVLYSVSPTLCSNEVNDLFAAAWDRHERRDFGPLLQRSLVYICAYRGPSLVGFVNVAWDGERTLSSWTRRFTLTCGGAASVVGWSFWRRTKPGSAVHIGSTRISSRICGPSTAAAGSGPPKPGS